MRSPVNQPIFLNIITTTDGGCPKNFFTVRDYRRAGRNGLWRQRDGYRIGSISAGSNDPLLTSGVTVSAVTVVTNIKTNHFILFFLVRRAIYFAQGRRIIDRRSSRSIDRMRQRVYGRYNQPDRWFPAPDRCPTAQAEFLFAVNRSGILPHRHRQ